MGRKTGEDEGMSGQGGATEAEGGRGDAGRWCVGRRRRRRRRGNAAGGEERGGGYNAGGGHE